MSVNNIKIVPILVYLNIILIFISVAFYFAMKNNLANLYQEESQLTHTLKVKKENFGNYILYVNKGLNINQFKNKHGINKIKHSTDENIRFIDYKNIVFTFTNGVLSGIQ